MALQPRRRRAFAIAAVALSTALVSAAAVGAYAGAFGLGQHFALAGQTVRPFRKLISTQAIFRREVFQ